MSRISETTRLLGDDETGPTTQNGGSRNFDKNVVDWDGDNDPANPMNWPDTKKWCHVALVSILTFLIPLGATMFAPGVKQAMQELHNVNGVLASLTVSIYVLGWSLGPLIVAPLSEVQGRWIVYTICNVLFVLFTVACATSSNLVVLIIWRFFAGAFGSTPLAIGGGTISDLIPLQRRGLALSVYMMGTVLGPSVGPVLGGVLTNALGWRWIFWILAIVYGAMTLVQIIYMKETYAGTILKKKTLRLQEETGNKQLRSKLDPGFSTWENMSRAMVRTRMTLLSPINLLLAVASACMNGLLFLLLTTFPVIFEQYYGFTPTELGLAFLGVGVGHLIGLAIFTLTSDRYIRYRVAQGKLKPEDRLIHVLASGPLVAVGLFWYGWTAQARTHWILPIAGSTLIGMGNILYFSALMGYLVDAFTIYAASAIAGNMVLRSIGGTFLPLVGRRMYQDLGVGWGNTVLGCFALIFTPALILLYRYGETLRLRYPIKFQM